MSPHLTAMLVGGGQLLEPGSSTGDTGFSYTQDSGMYVQHTGTAHACNFHTDYSQTNLSPEHDQTFCKIQKGYDYWRFMCFSFLTLNVVYDLLSDPFFFFQLQTSCCWIATHLIPPISHTTMVLKEEAPSHLRIKWNNPVKVFEPFLLLQASHINSLIIAFKYVNVLCMNLHCYHVYLFQAMSNP